MDIQGLRCHVVSSCVAAAMLAGCGGGSGRPLTHRLPDSRQRERLGASSTRPCTAFRGGAKTALVSMRLSSRSMAYFMEPPHTGARNLTARSSRLPRPVKRPRCIASRATTA